MYGFSLAVAAFVAVVALFTLQSPETPPLVRESVAFDGARAMDDVRTIATEFPRRVAGSEADGRLTLWLVAQLEEIGLEASIESFPAQRGGRAVGLQNVYAFDEGTARGTIALVANRDIVRSATQGANDNATGVAALLELARVFALTSHRHRLLFLWTDGDAEGGLGAADFVARHAVDDLVAVVGVRAVAPNGATALRVEGWSDSPRLAPPWLWLLAAPAARTTGAPLAELPGPLSQVLRLAAPLGGGLQAPFVAAGVPAVSLTAVAPEVPPPADTLETVSGQTLARVGGSVQAMVMTIDGAKLPEERSGGTIFLTRQRTLPGRSLALLLVAFFVPLLTVTLDLYAQCRRARLAPRPAWVRAALAAVPWLVAVALAYLANLVGVLPGGPGGVLVPCAEVIAEPRYLRIALLAAVFALVTVYVAGVERRVSRRLPADSRSLVLVAHVSLLLIAGGLALLNVYSLLLVLPAALLWPLARPGGWVRSVLPVLLGLSALVVAAIHCAVHSGLEVNAWWYLFVQFETRALPVPAALLGVFFLSTTVLYARAMHAAPRPPAAPAAPGEVGVDDLAAPAPEPRAPGTGEPGASPGDGAGLPPGSPQGVEEGSGVDAVRMTVRGAAVPRRGDDPRGGGGA
ncbi:MAG: M28 family peptidase [Thermoleophilia bacterium]|nr:M28 family peptidase [Thermoleophilia bacterium]